MDFVITKELRELENGPFAPVERALLARRFLQTLMEPPFEKFGKPIEKQVATPVLLTCEG